VAVEVADHWRIDALNVRRRRLQADAGLPVEYLYAGKAGNVDKGGGRGHSEIGDPVAVEVACRRRARLTAPEADGSSQKVAATGVGQDRHGIGGGVVDGEVEPAVVVEIADCYRSGARPDGEVPGRLERAVPVPHQQAHGAGFRIDGRENDDAT